MYRLELAGVGLNVILILNSCVILGILLVLLLYTVGIIIIPSS